MNPTLKSPSDPFKDIFLPKVDFFFYIDVLTHPDYLPTALAALRCQVAAVAVLAVQAALLLHKAHVLQRPPAGVHVADEACRAPRPSQGCDEGTSVDEQE